MTTTASACPICRAPIISGQSACGECGYRPGNLPDYLLSAFSLGVEDYTFQSLRGVDYEVSYLEDKREPMLLIEFTTPGGAELRLYADADPTDGPRRLNIWLGGVHMTPMGIVRAAEVASPLREELAWALFDINAESEARRFEAWRRVQARVPALVASPPDRLRSDFDLGSTDYEFSSASGFNYAYEAPTSETLGSVDFDAPSGSHVAFVLFPSSSAGRAETRIVVIVDDEKVNDRPFLAIWQFPQPIRWLLSTAIVDMNTESLALRGRRLEALERAGRHAPKGG